MLTREELELTCVENNIKMLEKDLDKILRDNFYDFKKRGEIEPIEKYCFINFYMKNIDSSSLPLFKSKVEELILQYNKGGIKMYSNKSGNVIHYKIG